MIIEYLFNMRGMVSFLTSAPTPISTFISLVLLFTPFYVIYTIIELFIPKQKEEFEDQLWENIKRPSIIFITIKYLFIFTWKLTRPILIQFKNVKFVIGFCIIAGLIGFSFYHQYQMDGYIPESDYGYDEAGTLIDAAPLSPSKDHWLGTDREGFDMFYKVVEGAKYTLSFAILIALLRVLFSSILAFFYAFFINGKLRKAIERFVDGYHYLSISLVALILLQPILWMPPAGFSTTFTERIFLEVFILTILALPVVSVLIGNEMKMLLQEEYVTSTKLLGGGRFHVLWKHIRLNLGPKLGVIFGQQTVQVLLLFTHLGLFQLFFGGTEVCYGAVCDPPKSLSNEWSGLIGNSKNELMVHTPK
jgi:peptide/nickel transport system permease protein